MNTPKQDIWPYDKIFDQPREGLYMQVHTTYERRKYGVARVTITRTFYGKDDYQDTVETVMIGDHKTAVWPQED